MLSDFLKCEKVRCVDSWGAPSLDEGKVYEVVGVYGGSITVIDGNGTEHTEPFRRFKPILETAIQATDSLDDTPMGTRTVREFEVGDRVYSVDKKIHEIDRIQEDVASFIGGGACKLEFCCHATPENYELLCKLYPHIKFEAPPKELTGSDLCRAMLDKGWEYVPCYISADSDSMAKATKNEPALIYGFAHGRFLLGADSSVSFVCPFDPKTGNVLTSEVLDDL